MIEQWYSSNGRISKATFWKRFGLCFIAFIIVAWIYGGIILTTHDPYHDNTLISILGLVINVSFLGYILIQSIKRVHDVNRNAWFAVIPFYNLILFLKRGDIGENKFGPDPKATNG